MYSSEFKLENANYVEHELLTFAKVSNFFHFKYTGK